jgi:phenylpropionate dioxygenase-like ring-hydroxylating dioxygenase large terminal subunit
MSALARYWFVVAESRELPPDKVLARQILAELLALFRDAGGAPVVLQDRCLHRAGPLSAGHVRNGQLTCPYHGWTYDGEGRVVSIPAETRPQHDICAIRYEACERDGYIYARLAPGNGMPFAMPRWHEPCWASVRLQNRFKGALADCVENFIDIPHTVFVHPFIRASFAIGAASALRRASSARVPPCR